MTATMSATRASAVGVPIAESQLTSAAAREQEMLLRPGPGRSRFVVQEAELGVGRPDLVVATAARAALRTRAERGLRLENLTEARVLASLHGCGRSGVSVSHERAVGSRLRARGWIDSTGRVIDSRPIVAEALIVEAKMKDWRSGMGQLVRNRWAFSGGAILLPGEAQQRVPRRTLRHNGIGLLVLEQDRLRWQVQPTWRPISWLASTWIAELLLRELDL